MKKELLAKKTLALAMTVLMAVDALTGCSSGSKETAAAGDITATPAADSGAASSEAAGSEAVGDSGETVIVRFRYWADNTDYSALMQDIIKKSNAENGKGITVVGEETPWGGGVYSGNLSDTKMGGGDIDCVTWKLAPTPLFVNNDLLADLTPLVDSWDRKDDVDENIYSIMKEAEGADRPYVMLWNIQVLYVYYRPSIFEAIGAEVPKTYEEFLIATEKYTMDTNGDGKVDAYGFGMRSAKGGQEPRGNFVHGCGGSLEDTTIPETVWGMQDFVDIYTKGHVSPTATSDGFNKIIANFKSGLTAMTIHHTGSSAGTETAFGGDVSAFPLPAGRGQWTFMGDTETVIFESRQNKEAAFEWVAYSAAGEGQKTWCEGIGNVPVSKAAQTGDFLRSNRFMVAFIEGQSYAGILPILDITTEWISTLWPSTVSQVLTGSITVEQCTKTLQDGLHR